MLTPGIWRAEARFRLCHHENSAKPIIKLTMLITIPAISAWDRFRGALIWPMPREAVV